MPAPTGKRVLVVLNPVAGPRGSQRAGRDLKERAQRLGAVLDVVETRPDLDGAAAVSSASGGYDCYVAMGGDGTVMEVAEASMRDDVPLAIIPRGTANAVAWHFGLSFDVGVALRTAIQGKPVRIDLARAEGRDFLIMAGLGYDAAVMRDATRVLKRRFGFLAYLYAAAKNLGRSPNTFRVFLDGDEPFRVRGASAIIANIGTLAGNLRVVRQVDPQDGLLDLVVVGPQRFGDFFRLIYLAILGQMERDPRVRFYQAARIRVECRPEAPLQIDGDVIEGRHRVLEATAVPRALRLMVPTDGKQFFPWMPDVQSLGDGFAIARERWAKRIAEQQALLEERWGDADAPGSEEP